MKRTGRAFLELLALVGTTALAGAGCCGPILLQWLGLALWAIGGRALLAALLRFEVPLLLGVAALSLLGRRLARDRAARLGNTVLTGTSLGLALLRLLWDADRGAVMAIGPLYDLFTYRQTALAVTGAGVLALRATALLISQVCQVIPTVHPTAGHLLDRSAQTTTSRLSPAATRGAWGKSWPMKSTTALISRIIVRCIRQLLFGRCDHHDAETKRIERGAVQHSKHISKTQ